MQPLTKNRGAPNASGRIRWVPVVTPGSRRSAATWARALGIGAVAGMRSMMPAALLAVAASRGGLPHSVPEGALQPWGALRTRGALAVSLLAAAGELVGDMLPVAPSRLRPGPLGGRLVIGGLAGVTVAREEGGPAWLGAALGAAGALAGAFGGFTARRTLVRATRLPDPVWAVTEDALAISLGVLALRPYLFGGERSAEPSRGA